MHLREVAILKVKVQNLETKIRTLKSTYTSTNIISTDFDKYVGQRSCNKSGIGY
jgi:hypothetical protein